MGQEKNLNYLDIYKKAIRWFKKYSLNGKGIAVTSKDRKVYPEVTGYYIPTLLEWGFRKEAVNYAKHLCSIQTEAGAWCAPNSSVPYVFDSAQILKGLLAIEPIMPEVKLSILSGCNWLVSNMRKDGRLLTPDKSAWGNKKICSELVHIYCLTPLLEAAKRYEEPNYAECAKKILNYYITVNKKDILSFNILSHFYAYVIEGLIDLGEIALAKEAMKEINKLQGKNGFLPAYRNVKWSCSTAMFQFAVIWYKLGQVEKGDQTFAYACALQNNSGGWYGGYPMNKYLKLLGKKFVPDYFPDREISWAVKYFLDAFNWKLKSGFEKSSSIFLDKIEKSDGRYQLISKSVKEHSETHPIGDKLKILDVGCGKGRYIKNLTEDFQQGQYYAVDISEEVMKRIPDDIIKQQGSLLRIPFASNTFDFVYSTEALEHAVDIGNAIRELNRVLKPGGTLVIIDKSLHSKRMMELCSWEQWFDEESLAKIMKNIGFSVEIVRNIKYNNNRKDHLFSGWICRK